MFSILAFLLSLMFMQEPTAAPVEATAQVQVPQLCVVHVETLHYPPLARSANVQGEVKVSAMVDEDGSVILPALETGHPLLAAAAIANLRRWKFRPPTGRAVPIEVTYEFVVRSGAAASSTERMSFDFPNHVRVEAGPLEVEPQASR